MHRSIAFLAVLGGLLAGQPVRAEVKLPAILSDHAVLQRDASLPIWGWADPGEEVTITLAGQTRSTRAAADGKWLVRFDRLPAGGPLTLDVKGKNTLTVRDLLVGEVWLGSGQSNMAMTVNRCLDAAKEKTAATFPAIRMFREASDPASQPQQLGSGKWEICSPDTVDRFSATAYFFGREIHKALQVPVGLINSSVGGTPIEAWTRWDAQKDRAELKPLFEKWDRDAAGYDPKKAEEQYQKALAAWKEAAKKARDAGQQPPRAPRKPVQPRLDSHHPATLFNGKIAPLIPYAIRGALWYQGENNANRGNAASYAMQLRLLIEDWRKQWGEGDFPFAWVQLPNFRKPQSQPVEESGWVTVREAMTRTLALPNTGMAITLDIGEANDIHPRNKQEVGRRLALWALATVYGKKDLPYSGPLYARHQVRNSEVVVSFQHTEGGLKAQGGELKGFAIAGPDGKWVWARARIEGNTVIVSHPDVKQPRAVRYAWAENPLATLVNGAGLPAGPFRTDN